MQVSFSPDDEGRLTTSGTGHIRFWRVASTFTGLKLQGEIGKFGKIEMTDIDCFCHMPDGKVVSGAESGSLLIWEGQFIKCRVVRPGRTGCHDGPVLHVSLDRTDMLVVTSGADGYIRWWLFADIDTADADDDSMCCEVVPMRELFIGESVSARCVERGGVRGDPSSDHLLVTDGKGVLWKVPTPESIAAASTEGSPSPDTTKLATFHAGAITGVDTSFLEQLAATCGVDGTVRIWDFLTKKPLEMARFPRPAQCLQWANDYVDPAGHTVAVGFADGVVRVLVRDPRGDGAGGDAARAGGGSVDGEGSLRRAQTLKPHDGAVVSVAYSPNGKLLATVGKDCKLFFVKSYLTAEVKVEKMAVIQPTRETCSLLPPGSHSTLSLVNFTCEGSLKVFCCPSVPRCCPGTLSTEWRFFVQALRLPLYLQVSLAVGRQKPVVRYRHRVVQSVADWVTLRLPSDRVADARLPTGWVLHATIDANERVLAQRLLKRDRDLHRRRGGAGGPVWRAP